MWERTNTQRAGLTGATECFKTSLLDYNLSYNKYSWPKVLFLSVILHGTIPWRQKRVILFTRTSVEQDF